MLPSDWNDSILPAITSANALVLAGTFSMKFAFILDINNRGFEFFFWFADIECEKWVKCLIIARCYGGLSYNSSMANNLTPNKAASPYTLENFWLANDKF